MTSSKIHFVMLLLQLASLGLVALADFSSCPGYRVDDSGSTGERLLLSLRKDAQAKVSRDCDKYGPDYQQVMASLEVESSTRLHVTIKDLDNRRWSVPSSVLPRPGRQFDFHESSSSHQSLFRTEVSKEQFGFSVIRRVPCSGRGPSTSLCDGSVIFNSSSSSLVFKEQYMELSTSLPLDANIYGLGEVQSTFRRDSKKSRTTIWSRDVPTPTNENLYGSQPFYIEIRDGQAHGVFFVTSTGLDVELESGKLSYKSIGGIIELYILLGPTPQDVLRQYAQIVGRPALMPAWSFGWHQCRWGYASVEEVDGVVTAYNRSHIPLEAMWIDIDYMDGYRDFTYDPRRFPVEKMKSLQADLHKSNQKLVLIVDPGIKIDRGYPAYDEGVSADLFIKNPRAETSKGHSEYFVGEVWPGRTHFPDWFHPETQRWWTEQFRKWFEMVPVDGIWIDMNELANFCERGDCDYPTPGADSRLPAVDWSRFRGVGSLWQKFNPYWPQYKIDNGGFNRQLPLDHRTSPMDAVHYNNTLDYFVHNLYGHMEGVATYEMLKQLRPQNERPFILSRSTFSGSGRFMAHWLGDNWSTWESLRYSIPGILSFTSVYSIPMVGADVCGFLRDTDEELCRRWTQLAAVAYPFARNHNWNEGKPQEPYLWPSVAETSRKYLNVRYQLLLYWYTLFWRAHEFGDSHVVRPLAWEFCDPQSEHSSPFDAAQVLYLDRQLLVGPALLVIPVLEPGATSVRGYVPRGVWYSWVDSAGADGSVAFDNPQSGGWQEIEALADHIPLFIRAGYIIPLHNELQFHRTKDIWDDGRLGLVIALNPYSKTVMTTSTLIDANSDEEVSKSAVLLAEGELYIDSEAGIISRDSGSSADFELQKSSVKLKVWMESARLTNTYRLRLETEVQINFEMKSIQKSPTIDRIRVFGLKKVLSNAEALLGLSRSSFARFKFQDASTSGDEGNVKINEVSVSDKHSASVKVDLEDKVGSVEFRWDRHQGLSTVQNEVFTFNVC